MLAAPDGQAQTGPQVTRGCCLPRDTVNCGGPGRDQAWGEGKAAEESQSQPPAKAEKDAGPTTGTGRQLGRRLLPASRLHWQQTAGCAALPASGLAVAPMVQSREQAPSPHCAPPTALLSTRDSVARPPFRQVGSRSTGHCSAVLCGPSLCPFLRSGCNGCSQWAGGAPGQNEWRREGLGRLPLSDPRAGRVWPGGW